MPRRNQEFQTIRSEGGLLPPDILRRVLDPGRALDGTQPEDYGLPKGERLNEVITQSWSRLLKHWAEFSDASANLPDNASGTGLTNDKWSLPLLRELGFGLLPTSPGPEIEGRTYAINRFFGPVPIHLIGCGLSLDRRTAGARGAATVNPHGLVQEFLNRSNDHLWAFVSNGLRLRILRDNLAMSRQSFLEFDLESMFAGEVYSDFVLLWLTAHATRFSPLEGERPDICRLEKWTKLAEEQGTRALGDLRGGVERALQILGEGFTSHPKNSDLRDALRDGQVSLFDFHGQLLRVIYRLIFLFVAEDRTINGNSLLHPIDASEAGKKARECYATHYSTARLREVASKIKGSRHGDLWRQFQVLLGALSGEDDYSEVRKHLGLPVLGSFLWDPNYTSVLNDAELTNYDFLEILRHLCFTRKGNVLRPVDYKNIGAEELGGVYECLLSLTPQISSDGARFSFAEFVGSERKTSGSYYTPDSLVQRLLDSALDPVVDKAIQGKTGLDAEEAILNLKVCDPAVGSGHFLVGAAHRLARHLARVRALTQGESEPSPLLYQQALRNVIGHCLYGVDINPMSAELCRVSLWLEALEPGKPLSFLDHHIRVGNSLLGATPELIADGLPDNVFKAIEGDDKKVCTLLKKRNKSERKGLGPLFAEQEAEIQTKLAEASSALELLPDNRPEDIRVKELAFHQHEETEEYSYKKQLSDVWCAAFVIKKYFIEPGRDSSAYGITQNHITEIVEGRPLPQELQEEVDRLTNQYQFFHWHLVYPEVYAKGGFDCVLANPPWERIKIQEEEWFSSSRPDISNANNAATRKRMINALATEDSELYSRWMNAKRIAEGSSAILRNSGRFPLCGRGDVNTYAVFAELSRSIINSKGYLGIIIQSDIATGDTYKLFFEDLLQKQQLVSFYDFQNKEKLFAGLDTRNPHFCLLTLGPPGTCPSADFSFWNTNPAHLDETNRHFKISFNDLSTLNPNTRTCPVFRSKHDSELTIRSYQDVPILIDESNKQGNPWGISLKVLFHMANDSEYFHERDELEKLNPSIENGMNYLTEKERFLPLYEGKMTWQYDHRWTTYQGDARATTNAEKENPNFLVTPQYWVSETDFKRVYEKKCYNANNELWKRSWFLGYRDVTNSTNERTFIASIIPKTASNHKYHLIIPSEEHIWAIPCLLANLNAIVFDFLVRQKYCSTSLSDFYVKQFPVFPPSIFKRSQEWLGGSNLLDWIKQRVLELTYTAYDLRPFAQDYDFNAAPYIWKREQRIQLAAELDAVFFYLYNFSFEEAEHAINSFSRLRINEKRLWGEFRTKREILACYKSLLDAIEQKLPFGRTLK